MTEHEQDSKFTKNKRQDGENKMDIQEWIIFAIELIGTVAFSASGAMVGIECSMDIFGVIVLGVSTAVGGGMVRDVILGKVPSALLHPVYVIYAVLAAVLVFCIIYFRRKYLQDGFGEVYDKLMLAMDSIGLGIFSAMGVTKGISCGYIDNTFLLVFLGTMTGVGGGLLRDTMAGVAPYIFVKHIYACASIAGAWICDHIQKLRRTSGDGGVITDRYADTFSCGSLQMESSKDRRVKIREGKEYFAR